MKRFLIRGAVTLIVALICSVGAYAQQVRVALKGDAYLIKEGKYVALEVASKIVLDFDEEFTEIITSSGKYFAATDEDGGWYIYNRNGKEVEIGGGSYGSKFDKARMVDGTIIVEKNGKTHYFNESDLTKEVMPQQASGNFFEEEIERNGGISLELAVQRSEVEKIRKEFAQVDSIGWFSLKNNATKGIDLVVDGKVLFNARSFTLISNAEDYKKSNCWFFIVTRGDYSPRYAVYGISMFLKDGKKEVENTLTIPYEYSFIGHEGGNMVKCSKNAGSPAYFNWWGWRFTRDWRTGQYTSTNEKWVHDESADKWTLQKKE